MGRWTAAEAAAADTIRMYFEFDDWYYIIIASVTIANGGTFWTVSHALYYAITYISSSLTDKLMEFAKILVLSIYKLSSTTVLQVGHGDISNSISRDRIPFNG